MPDMNDLIDEWHTGKAEFLEFIDPIDGTPERPDGVGAKIKCRITVTKGPFANATIMYWGAFRGRAKEITEKQLTAMGWVGRGIKQGRGIGTKEFRFKVENNTYLGKTSPKVVAVVAPKNTSPDPFASEGGNADEPGLPF